MDALMDSFPGLEDFMHMAVHPNGLGQQAPCGDAAMTKGEPLLLAMDSTACYSPQSSRSTAMRRANSSCNELAVMFAADQASPRASSDEANCLSGAETSTGGVKAKQTSASRAKRTRQQDVGGSASRRCATAAPSPSSMPKALVPILPKIEYDDDDDDMLLGERCKGGIVSHSTVEKRRRDRINTLIDLLADQVPPLSAKYRHSSSSGVRRPKHVVLSDTLSLLTKIRGALKGYELKIAQLTSRVKETVAGVASDDPAAGNERGEDDEGHECAAAPVAQPPAPARMEKTGSRPDLAALSQTLPLPVVSGSLHLCADLVAEFCADPSPALAAPQAWLPQSAIKPMQLSSMPLMPAAGLHVLQAPFQESPERAFELLSLPNVQVQEQANGLFRVRIMCMTRPELRADVSDGLCALPVHVAHADFSCGSKGIAQVELLVSSQSSSLSAEQLQMAMYMSVCCSCPLMPAMDGGAGESDADAPWLFT